MNTAELGVYILGATALALLMVAGIAQAENTAITLSVLAAGCAYLSQLCAANYVNTSWPAWLSGNLGFMVAALAFWSLGFIALLI